MNGFFETAVPCCGFIFFFAALFGFIAFMRYMNYRETLALAEKGLVKPERRSSNGTLFWGIGLASVGMALCLGLWPIGFFVGDQFPFGLGPWLIVGLIPMFFGIGLVIFYVLTREPKANDKPEPTPPSAPAVITYPPAMAATPTAAPVAVPPVVPVTPPEVPPTELPKSE